MEHPFKVEEFVPEHAAYTNLEPSGFVRAVPELESAVALPPLPNLPVSEVIFLRPSDPQYASYLPAANLRTLSRNPQPLQFQKASRCGARTV
jgi:hypothetical protein